MIQPHAPAGLGANLLHRSSLFGRTVEEAWRNLREVFDIFLEETVKKGTLQELLEEAGFVAQGETLERPEYFIGRMELPLPASR